MNVITLTQIKAQLGLSDATHDTTLTALLPELDAKVKAITGRRWNRRVAGDLTVGETEATLKPLDRAAGQLPLPHSRNIGNAWPVGTFAEGLEIGAQLSGTGVAAGAFITDILPALDYEGGVLRAEPWARVEMSAAATATATTEITVGISIAYHNLIAKLGWWMLEQRSTTSPDVGVFVKRMGPLSINYGTANSKIDGRYGVPRWAVAGLPIYGRAR